MPITGVVEPGAREAARTTRCGRIGITGTEATIRSGAYERLLKAADPQIEVYNKACPLFVPLVEEGWFTDEVTRQVVRRYLTDMKQSRVDTLVLGCTHYPLLRRLIQEEMGSEVTLVNPSASVVHEMQDYLKEHRMESGQSGGTYEFYVSDSTRKFQEFGQQVLQMPHLAVQKINIEKY